MTLLSNNEGLVLIQSNTCHITKRVYSEIKLLRTNYIDQMSITINWYMSIPKFSVSESDRIQASPTSTHRYPSSQSYVASLADTHRVLSNPVESKALRHGTHQTIVTLYSLVLYVRSTRFYLPGTRYFMDAGVRSVAWVDHLVTEPWGLMDSDGWWLHPTT